MDKLQNKVKRVWGVGINDADYFVQRFDGTKLIWLCPFYSVWKEMLKRCYSGKYQERHPSYKGCVVCDEWLVFSNFRSWMEQQDWENKNLDKDLLVKGNKIYSPSTCVFIEQGLNKFLTDRGSSRGEYLIGVNLHKQCNKFVARCKNPFVRGSDGKTKKEHLGLFEKEQDAHNAWKKRKHELAMIYAAQYEKSDPLIADALRKRYF